MRAAEDRLFELWRQTGEPAALAEVFDRTAGALFRIALHMSGNAHEAEDLVQTTYLAAIENARAWDETRPFLPWLSGILANRARRAHRRTARRAPLTPSTDSAGPVQATLAREVRDELEKAIDAAPEAYRPVLVLHLIYGHAPIEIAHALRRPPGTVRSQLSRGLELLRQRLPRGLATGVLAMALAGPALAAVRGAVLAKGTASGVAILGGGVITGGMLMHKLLSVVAVAVVGVVLWASWPPAVNLEPLAAKPAAGALPLQAAPPARSAALADAQPAPQRLAVADAAEATTGSLLVRVHWGEDDAPAMHVHVQLEPARSYAELFSLWYETDGDGNLRIAALTPGHYHVRSDRGPLQQGPPFEVRAGVETLVELALPPGVDVNGIVVDDSARPIAGAQVWLSAGMSTDAGHEVAQTGADGTFALRDVEAGRFVTAMARGYRVIAAHKLTAIGTDQVRIVLPGDGGVLEGRVFDADGKPCPNATVVSGLLCHNIAWSPAIADWFVPARRTRTDADGRFALLDVDGKPGRYPNLWVRAPGHTTWRSSDRERPPGPLEIHLQRGATLVGDVIDVAGKPVPGLHVEVACASIEPTAGSAFQGPDWARPDGYTRDDGSLRIDNLPLGPFDVRAGDRERGWANGSFVAHEGETLTWHGALRELAITGVVVDEGGRPLAGWSVSAVPPHEFPQPRATSGADGLFVIRNCEDSTYTLAAWQPKTPGAEVGWHGCRLLDVAAGATSVTLRVPDSERPSTFVTGTVLGDDRTPQAGVSVKLDRTGQNNSPSLRTNDDGVFRVGPLPPGPYTLTAGKGERWLRRRLPTLAAGQTLDLGALAFAAPGAAEIHIVDADGKPLDGVELRFAILAEPDEHWSSYGVSITVRDGTANAMALQPGHYVVHFGSNLRLRLPQTRAALEVRSGETVRLRLQLPRGVNLIERWLKPERPVPFTFAYECRRDGELVESFLQQDCRMVRDGELTRCFAPGRYTITVTAEDGARTFTEFTVATSDPPDRVIEIRLP